VLAKNISEGHVLTKETTSPPRTIEFSMISIGDYLKQNREQKKISLNLVSQKTKININVLRAIESNDFKSLPSPAYIKGFVLSYAKVVQLEPADVINKLEYTYLTLQGKPFPALNHIKEIKSPELENFQGGQNDSVEKKLVSRLNEFFHNSKHRRILLSLSAFLIIGITFYIGFHSLQSIIQTEENDLTGLNPASTNSAQQHPWTPHQSSKTQIKEKEITKNAEQLPLSKATPTLLEKTPEASISTPASTATKQEVAPQIAEPEAVVASTSVKPTSSPVTPSDVTTELSVTTTENSAEKIYPFKDFRKIKAKLFAFIDNASENNDESVFPIDEKNKFKEGAQNFYIKSVTADTWITYKIDDGPITTLPLKIGASIYLQGSKLRIFIGNVAATKVFYQNKLISAPTPSGFKSLIFPESYGKELLLPLFPQTPNGKLITSEEYVQKMKAAP
jgi:cytoskeletal protein RodZ